MKPEQFAQLAEFAKQRHEDAKTAVADLERQLREAKARVEQTASLHEAMRGLSKGWRDEDPGKYSEAWYLIRPTETVGDLVMKYEPMWAVELADDPVAITQPNPRRPHAPGPAAHGPLSDACQQTCPQCGRSCLLIGRYSQTDDDLSGNDTWEETLFDLCAKCQTLTHENTERRGHRFRSFIKID